MCEDTPEVNVGLKVFSNSLILQHIANYCQVDELKALRVVSRTLYSSTLPVWKRKAAVCLGPHKGWGRISIQEYMGRLSNSAGISNSSFQNFTIEFGSLPAADSGSQTSVEARFWKACGRQMKHLNLKHCRYDQEKFLNAACRLSPNLEGLQVYTVQRGGGWVDVDLTRFAIQPYLESLEISNGLPFNNWMFLQCFPNLKRISLRKCSLDNLLRDLCHLRKVSSGRTLNITSLDLIHTQQSLSDFTESQLSLDHLTLRLDRLQKTERIRELMTSQCRTLRSLKLFRLPLPNWAPLSSTVLQVDFTRLTELHLWGRVVDSFNFLKSMTSLKKLVVDLLCYDKSLDIYDMCKIGQNQCIQPYHKDMVAASSILIQDNNFQIPSLEWLEIDYEFSTESFRLLKTWMPNLHTLKTILNDRTLSMTNSQWSSLEHVKAMFGSELTDEGMTGLTCLSNLRSFEYDCFCDTSQLTDHSVTFAFSKLARLERLQVCVSPLMTEGIEEALLRKTVQVDFIRNYGPNHLYLPINCCQRVTFYSRNESLKNPDLAREFSLF